MTTPSTSPTPEQVDELLLSCRYGELEDVKAFVETYGVEAVVSARDERGNSAVHMCCGNGHVDVLKYLLPNLPASILSQTNESGSPPLHWAILNNHVAIVQLLVEIPEEQGGGLALLKQKNQAGREAFEEALFAGDGKEEVAGWIEGYLFKHEGPGDEEEGPDDEQVEEEGKVDSVDEVTGLTEEVTLKETQT